MLVRLAAVIAVVVVRRRVRLADVRRSTSSAGKRWRPATVVITTSAVSERRSRGKIPIFRRWIASLTEKWR